MRLSSIPVLPNSLVSSLDQCGIRTETDFLFSYTVVDIFQRLPPGTVSMNDLTNYIALVTKWVAAPGTRGDELLHKSRNDTPLSTGVSVLDELLGGFGISRVLEISGNKGTGKTSLARHVVLRHLTSHERSGALWIDTTGEFSSEKLLSILDFYDGQHSSTALQRLQVASIFDIEAAHDVLENLNTILSEHSHSDATIRCVVIDSITPLLGPLLSAVSSRGHAIMTTFMRRLRALAQTFSLAILVVNNATNATPNNPQSLFSSTTKKPALGPSFAFLTDATLWLARAPELDLEDGTVVNVAEVLRSRITFSRTWCTFKLRQGVLLGS